MTDKFKKIAQNCLIFVLIVLVGLMMFEIHRLQGTAQIVNYAGIVRGATQRLVKLEISGNEYEQLQQELDHLIVALKHGGGSHDLVRLDDAVYQDRLAVQSEYWELIKEELTTVRASGPQGSDIVNLSEVYFHLADETVNAAVDYSEGLAKNLRYLEISSVAVMFALLLLLLNETVRMVKIRHENLVLQRKAYIDLHTGLPNKSRCEELLHDVHFLDKATACMVFDINNLKETNDALGHSAGDILIQNFARVLRNAVPAQHIVVRYGGDEFMVVARAITEGATESLMKSIKDAFEHFNATTKAIPISFACGWAHSGRYDQCTLKTLFDFADKSMYDNKVKMNHGRASVHPTPMDPPAKA